MNENWLEKSLELIRKASSSIGITASLNAVDNYGAVFCRDAVMAGIVGVLTHDKHIIDGLKNSLLNFQKLQGKQGQIASNYSVSDGEITGTSYGTLSPKIDACTWYLIGTALLIKEGHVEKDVFETSILKTVDLLEGLEYNGKHLVYVPKGGNWADEYVYEGYVLYDQALRAWSLALLAPIFENPEWALKSEAILKRVNDDYPHKTKDYYNSSIFPGGVFDKFDLAAHAILGIISETVSPAMDQSYEWIRKTFLNNDLFPPAFYPVIDEGDKDWDNLSKYHLYRFKNKPNHFHNGGIWWIWLGWLSVGFSTRKNTRAQDELVSLAFNYLETVKDFEFDEYLSSDKLEPNGTKDLCFTAAGIAMLYLSKTSYDFSMLKPGNLPLIKEPLKLKSQYFDVSSAILKRMEGDGVFTDNRIVIAVCGESGSGKSVTALCLQNEFEQRGISTITLHQDSYFHLPPKKNHEERKKDIAWVGSSEVNLEKLQDHIDTFKNGVNEITAPVVDYQTDDISDYRVNLSGKKVLIVEGVYAFLLKNLDYGVYMSRTFEETLDKRKQRSREEYSPFAEEVLAIEQKLILPYKKNANVVVGSDYKLVN